jgi:hypothetical protein
MIERRAVLAAAGAIGFTGLYCAVSAQSAAPAPPYFRRGLPGPGQAAMKVLAGKWQVSISLYMAMGSPDHPVTSTDITTNRNWIDDGRFLQDLTSGTIAGASYWRHGILGYDNMASRYQWVTEDVVNAGMMIYEAASGSGFTFPANMTGSFVDQGVLGEAYVGKVIRQRTEIVVKSADEHIFNIYFTPPGEPERLADHNVYTRLS